MIANQSQNSNVSLTQEQLNMISAAVSDVRCARKDLLHKIIHLEDVLNDVGVATTCPSKTAA